MEVALRCTSGPKHVPATGTALQAVALTYRGLMQELDAGLNGGGRDTEQRAGPLVPGVTPHQTPQLPTAGKQQIPPFLAGACWAHLLSLISEKEKASLTCLFSWPCCDWCRPEHFSLARKLTGPEIREESEEGLRECSAAQFSGLRPPPPSFAHTIVRGGRQTRHHERLVFPKVSGFFTFPKVLGTRPVDHFRCLSKTPNFIMARV